MSERKEVAGPTRISGGGRRRRRIPQVPVTHSLQEMKGREWVTIHEGSQANCDDQIGRVRRWYPEKTYQVVTVQEAKAERRRKTWSVSDPDHIPDGSTVLLARAPKDVHPSLVDAKRVFGSTFSDIDIRRGTIKHRYRRSGAYMVQLEGATLQVAIEREDLIYPVPDNVIPLARRTRR
jgi:hypothetical protein